MERETFKKLWKDLALIEIQKTIASFQDKNGLRVSQRESDVELRDNTYSRYESERINFRDTANIKEEDLMDRHKIAAWLYSAFVFRTDKNEYSFVVYGNDRKRMPDLDAIITHEIAFNIIRGVIVSFAISDSKTDPGYGKFLAKSGMPEPKLICFEKKDNTSYKKEVLKQLIYAQKENKLSVAQLAIAFFSLENNAHLCYELEAARQFSADIVKRQTQRKKAAPGSLGRLGF